MLLFSKMKQSIFFGYFHPKYVFLCILKINNIRGDLTDISATRERMREAKDVLKCAGANLYQSGLA